MTDDQELNELDAMVAEKVMDWEWERDKWGWVHVAGETDVWSPSRDIADAWDVIEKLQKAGNAITLIVNEHCSTNQITVGICVSAIKAVENKGKPITASSLGSSISSEYSTPIIHVAPPDKSATSSCSGRDDTHLVEKAIEEAQTHEPRK